MRSWEKDVRRPEVSRGLELVYAKPVFAAPPKLRPRRLGGAFVVLASLSAIAVPLACAPAMEPVGLSTGGGAAAPPPPSASTSAPRWAPAKSVPEWPRANAKRFPSAGHFFGRYDADIHVSEAAREAYAKVGPGATMPEGTVIAELLYTKDGAHGPVLGMERTAQGWVYVEAQPDGTLVRKGALSPCVECHAHMASQDDLFGVPTTGR